MKEKAHKELHKYKAVIRHDPVTHHDYVEWISGKPRTNVPIDVEVSVWEEPWGKRRVGKDKENGKRLAELFEKLADKGAFSDIDDPVAWQREIRKDRPLPGRD